MLENRSTSQYRLLSRYVSTSFGRSATGHSPADKLTQTIRRVLAGERVIDPDLAAAALADGLNPLTPRERDVLAASADGGTIAEIARQLYLSEGTVRNYLSACIQKTGARNRAEALHIASERGWL